MFEKITIGLIVTFMAYAFWMLGVSAVVQKACLENGWASSKVTWNFQQYCIREENEYEITKPLAEILGE